ncbi:poly(U)-specific endoribonuclease homolog [Teleopsis dalmanni]|uniref:poly(U)-specific endoribonuclease homolog n=1 Tax=Teleopsis dalmanni TaxID=139649 RepID=UPI0018CDD0E2|nr:poly(U)-specific endoribonuclease homolog [Teleopsis dalmanni]
MLFMTNKTLITFWLAIIFVIQCQDSECYKSELEITPSPIEEPTTKKSGFFSGVKNFFRGSPSTTAIPTVQITTPNTPGLSNTNFASPALSNSGPTANFKPPPLTISHAPLMPLGPRPDTPLSSPYGGNPQQAPQWPQLQTTTTVRPVQIDSTQISQNAQTSNANFGGGQRVTQPGLPPGFAPYRPPKQQPSGLDLSYGNAALAGGHYQHSNKGSNSGLAHFTSSTTTTTSKSVLPQSFTSTTTERSLKTKEDFPALPAPRRPSAGAKEDFPLLPTPKSSISIPYSPHGSPSPWSSSIPPNDSNISIKQPTTPRSPMQPSSPSPSPTPNRVAFVPHAPSTGTTTTVRPGMTNSDKSLATDDELRAFSENLYAKEVNSQLTLIRINPQGKTRSIDSTDEAPLPLLDVDAKAFDIPTIAKMRLLFNNYEMDTMVNEHVSPNEHKEENDFLDAVMATSVMRQAMQFLQTKGLVSPDPKTHRDLVKELWFTQYSRGNGKIGSSGFEHVFVNEVKNGTIIGLHNWVYFYDEEKAGHLNYKGYLNQLDLGSKGKVLKVRFTHNGLNKPVNTLFVGTSPELELALYTVCFQLRPDRTCPVSLGNSKFGIVTYSWRYRGKSLIGSAYPEI